MCVGSCSSDLFLRNVKGNGSYTYMQLQYCIFLLNSLFHTECSVFYSNIAFYFADVLFVYSNIAVFYIHI